MTAVYYKHPVAAEYLLSKGAKIDARDKKGWSALYFAICNRDENMVKMLLDQGASAKPAAADQPARAAFGNRHRATAGGARGTIVGT